MEKNSGNIFDDQRGYYRDYFKPNFKYLGPLVSILQGGNGTVGSGATFLALDPNSGPLHPYLKKNSDYICCDKENTLGLILSSILGL